MPFLSPNQECQSTVWKPSNLKEVNSLSLSVIHKIVSYVAVHVGQITVEHKVDADWVKRCMLMETDGTRQGDI